MICPVCKRELAPTLSICLTCGAMMNDTVREELETKVGRTSGSLSAEKLSETPAAKRVSEEPAIKAAAANPSPRTETRHIAPRHTSQTLVEFKNRNAAVPEWRLQLQNVVRKRAVGAEPLTADAVPIPQRPAAAVGSRPASAPTGAAADERIASALRRVEASRKAFLPPSAARNLATPSRPSAPNRNFPFNVVTRRPDPPLTRKPENIELSAPPKPKAVDLPKTERKGFDTNKLPPLSAIIKDPPAAAISDLAEAEEFFKPAPAREMGPFAKPAVIPILDTSEDFEEEGSEEYDEVDDLAPFSMRFGAGLFDVIIAGFGALVVLSPLMVTEGFWLSMSGILGFIGTLAALLFLYSTAALGFRGRTLGMRLFSLELIDAEENTYPTIHQAAVNSAVFLLSLIFAGAGFLTIPFSQEKRALHDIISGTIIVREM